MSSWKPGLFLPLVDAGTDTPDQTAPAILPGGVASLVLRTVPLYVKAEPVGDPPRAAMAVVDG